MKFKVSDKVRFLDKRGLHAKYSYACPEKGTVGTVVAYAPYDLNLGQDYLIQWEIGSTSIDDKWHVYNNDIELISEKKDGISETD